MATDAKQTYEAGECEAFFARFPQADNEKARFDFDHGSGVYVCADGKIRTTGYSPSRDMPKALRGYVAVLKPRNGWSG